MNKMIFAAGLMAVAVAGSANAQALRAVSMLGGNEMLVLQPNIVNQDCSSDRLPDVRVIGKPANGTVRLEPTTITLNRPAGNPRANCNGRKVEAMGVYFKANDGFVGVERITLKADFRDGRVDEMVVLVDVR